MWLDTWSDVLRTVIAGATAYLALVLVLRVSGKRTLTKLNAFDLVVTVALGSTLATILLTSSVSVAEGVAALALLAALQFVAAILSSRMKVGRALLTSRPTILVTAGRVDEDALLSQPGRGPASRGHGGLIARRRQCLGSRHVPQSMMARMRRSRSVTKAATWSLSLRTVRSTVSA
jgi:hypothetical protein